MKVGDLVHNVPYNKYGVILEELEPIREPGLLGNVVERRFEVFYDKGGIILTGSTFLEKLEENTN
jgi:hypothetical protein